MAKGVKTGGRTKGTPNKSTTKAREAIALVADGMADEFMDWIRQTAKGNVKVGAKPDPKGAAELYLKAIEYHIPKLARTELTGEDGGVITSEIKIEFVSPGRKAKPG